VRKRLDRGKGLHDLHAQSKTAVTFAAVVGNHPDLTIFGLDQVQGEHLAVVSHGRRIASSDPLLVDKCLPNFAVRNKPAELKVGQVLSHGKFIGAFKWQIVRFTENE
jgi:hypothetical protein